MNGALTTSHDGFTVDEDQTVQRFNKSQSGRIRKWRGAIISASMWKEAYADETVAMCVAGQMQTNAEYLNLALGPEKVAAETGLHPDW